jgi:ABC-2 type transport system permease protein
MSTKKINKVFGEVENTEVSPKFWLGFKATFSRNVKIIWQYKLTLLFGFVNTFAISSLFFYVGHLVPNQSIGQDGYIVSSVTYIFAGSMLVDISTRIIMKSMKSFTSEMQQGTFETLATQPFGLKKYFLSEITFEVFYSLVFSIIYYIPVLLIFPVFSGINLNFLSILSLMLVIFCILFFFFSLSLLAANITILVKRGREISMVMIGVIHLLSGSLFPLSLFPEWLKIIAYFSPMTLSVQSFRLILFGQGTLIDGIVWGSVIQLLIMSIIVLILFNLTYKKIYTKIRQKGTVHEY